MKLLEKGPGWAMKCVCTGAGNGGAGCESILLVEKGDIFLTLDYDYSLHYSFKCMECGAVTNLANAKVPPSIRTELIEEYRRSKRQKCLKKER